MDNPQRHLRRGFGWLGGSTLIARAVDFGTILLVLLFLTKEQVGVASLVISIGMVIEAFEGLGAGEALLQARTVSRPQWDSIYWVATAFSLLVAASILLLGPLLADTFGISGMAIYFLAIAAKQPLTSAALIPIAMMNRELKYERIAVISVVATLGAAFTRVILAVTGAGAWALIIGFSAHGLFMLIGAQLANPFRPRLHFARADVSELLHFGVRASASNAFQQLFRNSDFILIGWFYGPAQLAIYRVAFDIAMEPALAIGALVNRTALPVFARVAQLRRQLSDALIWSFRRVTLLAAPLAAALVLVAGPLTQLLHDSQGHSYSEAALPLKLLAVAAFLRSVAELIYPLLLATGYPGTAMRLSAATLLTLTAGITVIGISVSAHAGIILASALWLAIYPLVLSWGRRQLGRRWAISSKALGRTFLRPALSIGLLTSIVFAGRAGFGPLEPAYHIGMVLLATVVTYTALFVSLRGAAGVDEMVSNRDQASRHGDPDG